MGRKKSDATVPDLNREVNIEFIKLDQPNHKITAKAIVKFWGPKSESLISEEDIVVLSFDKDIPTTLPSIRSDLPAFGELFSLFGMMERGKRGFWLSGTFQGLDTSSLLQITPDRGHSINLEYGFSGSPVFCQKDGSCVGFLQSTISTKEIGFIFPTWRFPLTQTHQEIGSPTGQDSFPDHQYSKNLNDVVLTTQIKEYAAGKMTDIVYPMFGRSSQKRFLERRYRSHPPRFISVIGFKGSGKSAFLKWTYDRLTKSSKWSTVGGKFSDVVWIERLEDFDDLRKKFDTILNLDNTSADLQPESLFWVYYQEIFKSKRKIAIFIDKIEKYVDLRGLCSFIEFAAERKMPTHFFIAGKFQDNAKFNISENEHLSVDLGFGLTPKFARKLIWWEVRRLDLVIKSKPDKFVERVLKISGGNPEIIKKEIYRLHSSLQIEAEGNSIYYPKDGYRVDSHIRSNTRSLRDLLIYIVANVDLNLTYGELINIVKDQGEKPQDILHHVAQLQNEGVFEIRDIADVNYIAKTAKLKKINNEEEIIYDDVQSLALDIANNLSLSSSPVQFHQTLVRLYFCMRVYLESRKYDNLAVIIERCDYRREAFSNFPAEILDLFIEHESDVVQVQGGLVIANFFSEVCGFVGREFDQVRLLRLAASIAEKVNATPQAADCYLKLSQICRLAGRHILAADYAKRALEMVLPDDNERLIMAHGAAGSAYRRMGKYRESEQHLGYLRETDWRNTVDSSPRISFAILSAGHTFRRSERLLDALEIFEEAFRMSTELEDYENVAISVNNMGFVFLSAGSHELSALAGTWAHDILKNKNNYHRMALCELNIGASRLAAGDFERGLAAFHLALEKFELSGDVAMQVLTHLYQFEIFRRSERWAEAYKSISSADHILTSDVPSYELMVRSGLGVAIDPANIGRGRYSEALLDYASAWMKNGGNYDVAKLLYTESLEFADDRDRIGIAKAKISRLRDIQAQVAEEKPIWI